MYTQATEITFNITTVRYKLMMTKSMNNDNMRMIK